MTNPWWQYEDDPEEITEAPWCNCTGNLANPMCAVHGDYDPYYTALKEPGNYER